MAEMQPGIALCHFCLQVAVSGKARKGFKCHVQFLFAAGFSSSAASPQQYGVVDKSIEKLVFMKWLCEAGSRKEQSCGMRSDSISNQNFPVRFVSVLKLENEAFSSAGQRYKIGVWGGWSMG